MLHQKSYFSCNLRPINTWRSLLGSYKKPFLPPKISLLVSIIQNTAPERARGDPGRSNRPHPSSFNAGPSGMISPMSVQEPMLWWANGYTFGAMTDWLISSTRSIRPDACSDSWWSCHWSEPERPQMAVGALLAFWSKPYLGIVSIEYSMWSNYSSMLDSISWGDLIHLNISACISFMWVIPISW